MYIHRGLKRHEVEISSGVEMTSVGDFSTMSLSLYGVEYYVHMYVRS